MGKLDKREGKNLTATGLIAASLGLALLCANVSASINPGESLRPAITNGLVHYWPDPWNARDEITGEEGAVMALLPEASSGDQIEFRPATGWVRLCASELSPAFSISCWLRWEDQSNDRPVVLWCEGESHRWSLQQGLHRNSEMFGVIAEDLDEAERAESFRISRMGWHHLSLVQDSEGRLRVWVDGQLAMNGTAQRQPLPAPEWLCVGNTPKGDQQWAGALSDLAWYTRPLVEAEVQALHRAGRSTGRSEPSNARRRAAGHRVEPQWNSNVTHVSVASMDHRRYTSEDNLPGNRIQALVQTRDGFLWAGTEYGLARFDGSRFERFSVDNTPAMAMVGCDISCLAEDNNGTLWAGVYGGLLRIRGSEMAAVTNGLPERFVLRIEPAGSNALWLAGYQIDSSYRGACRLRRYLPETGQSTAVTAVPGQVRRLVNTPDGVWIATEQPEMILFWDGRSHSPELRFQVIGAELFVVGTANASSESQPQLRGWRDPGQPGAWWAEIRFGADQPAFQWLARPGAVEAQANRWSGEVLRPGWVAAGRDLAQLTDQGLLLADFPALASPPEVEVLCANREGGTWLGTRDDGLHLVRERPLRMVTTAHGLADNDVRAVCPSRQGGLWVATHGGGSHWVNERAQLIARDPMRCVAEDPEGKLWWGIQDVSVASLRYLGPEGLQHFSLPGLEWRGPTAIRFARDGTLWVVCEAGVTWVKPERLPGRQPLPLDSQEKSGFGRLRRGVELPDSDAFGLVEDREGSIWVGSRERGLYRIRGREVEILDQAKGFPGSVALPALEDPSGALWILSDTGIIRHRNGRFELIGPAHGAPRDLFFGLVEDDRGAFWLPGGRGIHRVLRADLEAFFDGRFPRISSLTLGLRDGMLTPECSAAGVPGAAKLADGSIAVATPNGLALIDPTHVEPNTRDLPVIFEKVVANRRAVPIPLIQVASSPARRTGAPAGSPRAVELPAGSGKQLEIHYTAVSLVAADRVRFRYRLEGQDKDWSEETAQRIAFYSNLYPGLYRFRVQSSNGQGTWPKEEWSLGLVILPYFWQMRLFQAASVLAVAAAVVVLHRQRVRVLRDFQELRHRQQFASERARIAADMHDDLGAALTQIAILGEVAKRQLADSPQAASVLDRISQSARDVTSRMSDLVWATNPRHDSLDNLSAHLREQAARMLQDTAVHALLCFPTSLPAAHLSATVRRNVLLVMKEGINNALRHARPTEIRLTFKTDSAGFHLLIEDNGCGFDFATHPASGNGLLNMRKRIEDIGGHYQLISEAGMGTRIELRVPLLCASSG
jgi:signal transduction histidine kinase/ligand-binding sensor domain-containing protein